MTSNRHLQLAYMTGESATVETVDFLGGQEYRSEIGEVKLNASGLWSACDIEGNNHGTRYWDKWAAAKQLALGLGKGEYA